MMLIEPLAYRNRWRHIPAEAKAAFAGLAMVAAFLAHPPVAPFALAAGLAAVTIAGARIPARSFLRVALLPAGFLALSALTLAVTVHPASGAVPLAASIEPAAVARAVAVVGRSAAALSAMLFLALTTPMTDLIALARRLRVPAVIVEIMTVCYRSLSILSETIHDMRQAQSARLGYASFSSSVRSMGTAVGLLAVETWRRSIIMHQASVARSGGGELRFLEPEVHGRARALALAVAGGAALVTFAALVPGGVR